MLFKVKKEEIRTIIAGIVFFLLLKIMSDNEIMMSGSISAAITVLIIIIMNFRKVLSWINFMVIIPATVIIFLEIINEFFYDFVLAAEVLVILGLLSVWVLFQWAFKIMNVYWESCSPDKPRIKRMKTSLYIGSVIVLVFMIGTTILF